MLSVVKKKQLPKMSLASSKQQANYDSQMLPGVRSWSCDEYKSPSSFHFGGSDSRNRSEVRVRARRCEHRS